MEIRNNAAVPCAEWLKQNLILLTVAVLVAVGVFVMSPTIASAYHGEIKLYSDENYKLKFYGFINAAVMYDSKGSKGIDWSFASKDSDKEDSSLEFNVDNSRVGFLFSSIREGNVLDSLNLEFDFVSRASNNTLRIRNLYADFKAGDWNILFGQSWRTILTNIGPSTLSTTWLWGQGNPYNLMPQLRATGNFGDVSVNLVAMQQKDKMGDIIGDGTIKSNQPNFGADIGYKNGPFVAAVGGSIGTVRVVSDSDEKTNVTSSIIGAEAGVSLPVGGDNKISLGGKIFSSSGGGLGTAAGQFAVIDSSGKAHGIKSTGGFVDLGFDLNKTHIHGIYGLDNPKDVVEDVAVDRKKNQTIMGNISYDLTDRIIVGLEYQRVETKWTGSTKEDGSPQDTDKNDRVYAAVFYYW